MPRGLRMVGVPYRSLSLLGCERALLRTSLQCPHYSACQSQNSQWLLRFFRCGAQSLQQYRHVRAARVAGNVHSHALSIDDQWPQIDALI